MVGSHNGRKVHFEKPGKYRIVLQGHLDESWSDRLAGMRVTTTGTENGEMTTDLVGYLRDQTQLSGILNALHDLHLPILFLEWLESKNTD